MLVEGVHQRYPGPAQSVAELAARVAVGLLPNHGNDFEAMNPVGFDLDVEAEANSRMLCRGVFFDRILD